MASDADVLFVSVNEHETQALIDVFQRATGKDPESITIDRRTYRKLGTVNKATVYHALSEMGANGPGATQQTVDRAIRALQPGAVILVGIAFGVNERKQEIGDILVSLQLSLYELQRAGSEIIPRGDKPHASSRLINFFMGAKISWKGSTVTPGVLLSGDKLVDNIDYRTQLISFETEAIGGEMEGAGLYVASNEHKVDWIVIKSICDWGDGKKAKNKIARQKKAANAAAHFVLHALQHAPIISIDNSSKDGTPIEAGRDDYVIALKDVLVGMQGNAGGPVSIMSDWVMPMYEGIAKSLGDSGMEQVVENPEEVPQKYLRPYSDGLLAGCYFVLNAALTAPTTAAAIELFNAHVRPSLSKMLAGYFNDLRRTIRIVLGFYYAYDHLCIGTEILISSSREVDSTLDLVPDAQLQALRWTEVHGINTPELTFRIHDTHLVKFPRVGIPPPVAPTDDRD